MLKWAGIVVASLILLLVLASLILPAVLNLERYRSLLASRASRLLGREVTLGALHVSLWGGLGAEARGIRIAPAPGFGPDPFLTADDLQVRLQFFPLLRGQFKVTSVVLDRPHIRLMKTSEGRWNIEDLLKSPPPPAPAARPAPEAPRPAKPPLLGGLLLSEVAVKNGEILLVEQAPNAGQSLSVRLSRLDLSLRQKAFHEPILLNSQAELGEKGGRLEASGKIVPEADANTMDIGVTLQDVDIAPWQALLLGPRSAVRLSDRLSGAITVRGAPARASFEGSLDLTPLGIRLGPVEKAAGEPGRLTFRGQRQEPGLQFAAVALSLPDRLEVQGTAGIPDLRRPAITFDASSPLLDLDRLLARPAAKKAGSATGVAWAASTPRTRSEPATATTGPPGSSIAAQGHLRIADLRYAGLQAKAVEGDLRYRDGVLDFPGWQASFLQGKIGLAGQADFRAKLPVIRLTSRLTGVQTEPLVKGLELGSWTLQSALDKESTVTFTGLSPAEILGSANGKGALKLGQGRLLNYKPLDRLGEIVLPILAAQGVQVRLNEFQQVSGTFTLDKGVLRTSDLTLTKAEGTLAAAGSLSLLDSALNFDVTMKLGRITLEAKVTGTTAKPVVIPKLGRIQQRIEHELNKALPGQQGKGLQDLLKNLFGR